MNTYRIISNTGVDRGLFRAKDEDHAREKLARLWGYRDYATLLTYVRGYRFELRAILVENDRTDPA